MNPYLPLNKYIADGEAHVFDNRLYIYGSSDRFKGECYCPLDYEVFSCDINNLGEFTCHGISYKKINDPDNIDGKHQLYACDVVKGNDGRYYLYYFMNTIDSIAVAVSQNPKGPFEYYGKVIYPMDKSILPDYPCSFDPAVINDEGKIYLALGFSVDFKIEGMNLSDKNTKGGYVVELDGDMLTMKTAPKLVIPGYKWGKDTGFEGHEFLEAASLRKFNGTYYFIYSSQKQHELCYATAETVFGPYTYQGILISNAYENGLKNNWANNHGTIEKIKDDYYIFYHRHSCATQYSRSGCVEKINYDGKLFQQAKVTSQGFSGKLPGGKYPAAIACFLYDNDGGQFIGFAKTPQNFARIEGEKIVNIRNSTIIFRYFKHISKLTINCKLPKQFAYAEMRVKINEKVFDNIQIKEKMEINCDENDCEVELKFNSTIPLSLTDIMIE
ncbi:MAG: family 43 glycosylhydrolase [Erysipelotrichaceae bacterium]